MAGGMRNLSWTPELVGRFWDGVAHTRGLAQQSFGRLGGHHLLHAVRWHLQPGQRHLDFGGGDGDFAALLAAEGYPIAVYEPSSERAAQVSAKLAGRPGFLGTAGHEDEAQFDTIFLVEVIEHVLEADLDAVLARLDRLLAPGGRIIITTPNDEDLEENYAFEPAQGVLFHRWQHQRSFTGETLSALMATHGFAPRIVHAIELTDRIFGPNGAGLGCRPEFANFFNTDRPMTIGDGGSLVWLGGRASEAVARVDDAERGWRTDRLTFAAETRLVLPAALAEERPLPPSGDLRLCPAGMRQFRLSADQLSHQNGFLYSCSLPPQVPQGDSSETPERSVIELYEDGLPLGPGHSMHARIRESGGGRYSHWGKALFFSTSDDSDPRRNGKHYALRWPEHAVAGPQRFHLLPEVIEPVAGRAYRVILPDIVPTGNRTEDDRSATLELYEDYLPLGPAHATRERIIEEGRGRYVQQGRVLLFSTSDDSDPRRNGRRYALVWPAASISEKPKRG